MLAATAKVRRPVVLCVLDGWGWRTERADNAVLLAEAPCFWQLWERAPHTLLRTDGIEVGLPSGQFGNSEVGHLNLGAGRVVMQELPRIDRAIADGSLARNAALADVIRSARAATGTVHLMGLLSPGGVHSHQDQIRALAKICTDAGLVVWLHLFLDGRDTPPRSAEKYLSAFQEQLAELPGARIATIGGRYYAMDRDKRWERVAKAFGAMVDAAAQRVGDPISAVRAQYAAGVTDEFVEPMVVGEYPGMADGDCLISANFRADRVREILTSLLDPAFDGFARPRTPRFAAACGMTSYSRELDELASALFPPQPLTRLLGEVVAEAGLTQLRMAETEKYPHVTFFFNGGEERPYPGEERILVPSPKVATYDLQPEMSAVELTDRLVAAVDERRFDFILINFANPDMVGHTGDLKAAIRAVETVDACLGHAVAAVRAVGGSMLVTADHGNCELMRDPSTGEPHTAHTLNPVPCILVDGPTGYGLRDGGRLADVAPTILELLGIDRPAEMTGASLLVRRDQG